jgi:hypothetical protein
MPSAHNIKEVGYVDCVGGGQIVVVDGIAYIGHVNAPDGTSIYDVRDPKNPKKLASLGMPPGTHSHKVRVANNLMVINQELNDADNSPVPEGWKGGIVVYDIKDPSTPRELARWETEGTGVHRYDFDGRYIYMSSSAEGYVSPFVMIMDLIDPTNPTEVGRWWMPGQWTAGGEVPNFERTQHRCHHPLRLGNRLYVSYWKGGFVILDIEDMTKPTLVSGLNWVPPFACPIHTALPIPFDINGRKYLLVGDEDVDRAPDAPAAFMWMIDITDEKHPIPVSTYQIPELAGAVVPMCSGLHQPSEKFHGTEIPMAWFSNGLRVIDIKNPQCPVEVAHYIPDLPEGSKRVSSNDVTVDDDGLIYLLDRHRGLHILQRV